MNIANNNQNIAKDAVLNDPGKVENLTNYIANVFEGCMRKIRDSGCTPTTERRKSAIVANKIVDTIHSTAAPSPFRPNSYLNDGEVPVIASSKSRNITKIIVRFTNERILNLLPWSAAEIPVLDDTFAVRTAHVDPFCQ